MSHLIGLSGYAQCGKDTVGNLLVQRFGYTRRAFADRMKEIGLAIDPIIDFLHGSPPIETRAVRLSEIVGAVGWERAKHNPEVRQFLQRIGTEAGRALLGPDVWVDLLFADFQPEDTWVITDVRFKNEATRIITEGGSMIRINRPGVEPPNDHLSEHDLADWNFDFVIENDGELDDLEDAVDSLLFEVLQ